MIRAMLLLSKRSAARALFLGAVIAVMACVGATAAVSASARTTTTARSAAVATLVWGQNVSDTTNFDPFVYFDNVNPFTYQTVYESLTVGGPGGNVLPNLATSWKQTSPTTWVFQLRHDVRFSNGRNMVAADVVNSFQHFMKDGTYGFLFSPATTARAAGKYAVRFTLSQASTSFPAEVENLMVLPAKEMQDGTFDPTKQILGTGPWVVMAHVPDVSWTYRVNPYYWRKGYPKIKKFEVLLYSDEATLDSALRAGTVDFEQPSDVDAAAALASKTIAVRTIPTPDFYYIAMNPLTPTESAFKDVRVRQAVNLAINRKEIAQVALAGHAQITGIPSSSFSGGCDASKMAGTTQNLQRAKALLAAAGVSGLTTTIYIAPSTGAVAAPLIAEVVRENLAEIGITANIVTEDSAGWVNTVFTTSDFSITINWWTGEGDPTLRLTSWEPAVAGYDKGYVADDATLDGLISKSFAMSSGPKRTTVFQQICERVANDANIVPIVSKPLTVAYRSDKIAPVFPTFEANGYPFRTAYAYKAVGQR
jgi:peptide/nickel transport system substrate-binding protein